MRAACIVLVGGTIACSISFLYDIRVGQLDRLGIDTLGVMTLMNHVQSMSNPM